MAGSDITIEILKDIREEIRGVRGEQVEANRRLDAMNQRLDVTIDRLDVTIQRLDVTNLRLGAVETTLLDVAEQQRFLVRYAKASSERDSRIEARVGDLDARVGKLESR